MALRWTNKAFSDLTRLYEFLAAIKETIPLNEKEWFPRSVNFNSRWIPGFWLVTAE